MVKKIGIALVVLIVLIGGGVYYFLSNLDEFVRTAVEKAGTRATGVEVTLGKVALDVTGGKGSLSNLNVSNPSGFDTDYAFNLGDISVSLDLDSLQSNPIVITEVIVTSPKVIYEFGDGESNIDAIQRNVENFTKEISGGASSSEEAGGDGTKVVINDLYIRGADVRVSAPFLKGKAMGTEIPEIHLQDIGKESGGATPGEVAAQVLDSLTSRVQGVVSNLNLDELRDAATKAVEGAAGEATKALEGVGGAAGGAAGGALKGATEGVKGLFGGSSD